MIPLKPNHRQWPRSEFPPRKATLLCCSLNCNRHQLSRWTSPPTSILLIQKPQDSRATNAMGSLLSCVMTLELFSAMFIITFKNKLSFIKVNYPTIRIIVESHTAHDHTSFPDLVVVSESEIALLPLHTDMVITVGGDGTVLHTSNLFDEGECPPVLCFSMGSLGFLLPFREFLPRKSSYRTQGCRVDIDDLASVLNMTMKNPISVLKRMRLACTPVSSDGRPLRCSKAGACLPIRSPLMLKCAGSWRCRVAGNE